MGAGDERTATARKLRDLAAEPGRLERACRAAAAAEAKGAPLPGATALKAALAALADLDREIVGVGATPDDAPELREVVEHLLRFRHGRALAVAACAAPSAPGAARILEWEGRSREAAARVVAAAGADVSRP